MTLSWAEVLTSSANNHNSSSDNELLKKSDDWSWKRWELDNDLRRHQFYSFTWKSLFWFCSSGRGGYSIHCNEAEWRAHLMEKKICEQNNLNFLFIFVSRRIRRWVSTLTFINVSWWTELNCVTKKNVGRSKWISWIWYNKRPNEGFKTSKQIYYAKNNSILPRSHFLRRVEKFNFCLRPSLSSLVPTIILADFFPAHTQFVCNNVILYLSRVSSIFANIFWRKHTCLPLCLFLGAYLRHRAVFWWQICHKLFIVHCLLSTFSTSNEAKAVMPVFFFPENSPTMRQNGWSDRIHSSTAWIYS